MTHAGYLNTGVTLGAGGKAAGVAGIKRSLTSRRCSIFWPQVLWAEETAEKSLTTRQSFVDLGCGNGLLVHILTNEGVSNRLSHRHLLKPETDYSTFAH